MKVAVESGGREAAEPAADDIERVLVTGYLTDEILLAEKPRIHNVALEF